MIDMAATYYCQLPEGAPPSQMQCSTTPPVPVTIRSTHNAGQVVGGIAIVCGFLIVVVAAVLIYRFNEEGHHREVRAKAKLAAVAEGNRHNEELARIEGMKYQAASSLVTNYLPPKPKES